MHDPDEPAPGRHGALMVAGGYAFFASLWILYSDMALQSLFGDPSQIVRASVIKGWLFVAVTTVLLYVMTQRLLGRLTGALRREREAEAARRRTHQLLDAIAENSPDAIFAKDTSGRYVLFNPAAARIVGRTPEAMIGLDDRAIFPAAQAQAIIDADRRVMQSAAVEQQEETLDTTQGRRYFLTTKSVLRDADGRVSGVFGISHDITRRRLEEQTLRDSEQRWIMALDSAGHGVWDWDIATDTVYFSPRWKSMLGYAEDDVGNTLEDWSGRVHPDDLPACQAALKRHFRGESEAYVSEHRMRCKDGSYRWILDRGQVQLRDESGKPLRVVGTHTDIAETKATAEALRQSYDELQRFNRAAVGRELRMIELKQQVNALSQALGRPPPFPLDFLEKVVDSADPA